MLLNVLEVVLIAICCAVASRRDVHMLQLESYQLPGYRRWLSRNREYMLKHDVAIAIAATVLLWYMPVLLSLFIQFEETRSTAARWIVLIMFAAAAA